MTAWANASSSALSHDRVSSPMIYRGPGRVVPKAYAANATFVLQEVMRLAQIGVGIFSDRSLKLAALEGGAPDEPPFGLSAMQATPGISWYENVHPADREKLRAYMTSRAIARARRFVDYRLIVGEGELLWVRHRTLDRSPAKQMRGESRALIMAIPEQKHLEWECLRVSERECNRIGQELHDDLCQVLAGLTFMMRVVAQRAARTDAALAADIAELNSEVTGATDRVRSMAHGLFPTQLRYTTLRHALTAFATETRNRFRVAVELTLPPKMARHSGDQIIHAYRIAQEAVSNAVKHGAATAIRIALTPTPQGLQLSVEDNGKGFPTAADQPEGIGLHVMQYRARALGGTLEFKSLIPHGVGVRLAYPIGSSAVEPRSKRIAKP